MYEYSLFLSDVLCYPTDLIWRKGAPFEAMTGLTALLSDDLLLRFFGVFFSCKVNARRSVHSPPRSLHYHPCH